MIKHYIPISNFAIRSKHDLVDDRIDEFAIGYEYFDECFGLNINFRRSFYEDDNLKPEDVLTIMFSFKNVGSYKSTNLAVSENDKQDIEWQSQNINNEIFN